MKNTTLYLVSFSDTRKFRYETANGMGELTKVENELNQYLKSLYPDETFAYYTTPKVTEIAPEHADDYKDYPMLDSEAVDKIKEELKREIAVRMADSELNSDDPYNTVGPKY